MDYRNMPREQLVDEVLYAMRQGLTIDMYKQMRASFLSMPDEDFTRFMDEAKRCAEAAGVTPRSYHEALSKVLSSGGINSENSALNLFSVKFLNRSENETLWQDIRCSRPDDRICLKRADDRALCELWTKGCSVPKGRIPSDIFFSGRIPMMDCEIVVDETDEPHGLVCSYRVVIFPDYRERVESSSDEPVDVGALLMDLKGYTFIVPFSVCKGIDTVITEKIGHHNVPVEILNSCRRQWKQMGMIDLVYEYMTTWYGIQVALLHPTVKDVFRNPRTEPVYATYGKKGNHRRFVRYIRKHIINAEDIRQAQYGFNREYERHTLVWYVIGHWRHYEDGRKVFVQPYWKGALRELKMSLDGRDRKIIL